MAGMVSERLWSSSIRLWHDTLHAEFSAFGVATTLLRNVDTPPPLEMDFVSMDAEVSGAASTTLQPVSRFWPVPANVMPVNVHVDLRPARMDMG